MESNADRPEVSLQAQKMEVLGRLAGAVIHDLNNLLTVIQLNAGLIETGGLDRCDVLSASARIGEASHRAAELTRKVLNFARGQANESAPVHLQELVNALSRMLEPLVAMHVNIEILPGPSDLWVHGNRSAIEQAVMNLVLNAVDSMPAGGRIVIAFDERVRGPEMGDGKYAGIVIVDEGTGIPFEDQPRIFESFFTTKDHGTGMGLSIVRRIASLHCGMVEFDSEPGSGTEFRLWLPATDAPVDHHESLPDDAEARLLDRTVLLVEDDPGILDLTKRLLEALGLRVIPASTGEIAWELWKSGPDKIDLLFTDIILPGKLSGRDLAVKILGSQASLPVLYTSGYSQIENDRPYLTTENFLQKPFSQGALQRAIKLVMIRT